MNIIPTYREDDSTFKHCGDCGSGAIAKVDEHGLPCSHCWKHDTAVCFASGTCDDWSPYITTTITSNLDDFMKPENMLNEVIDYIKQDLDKIGCYETDMDIWAKVIFNTNSLIKKYEGFQKNLIG